MAVATATPKASAINPRLIVPFINSVRSVMSTMLSVEATIQRAQVKLSPSPEYDYSCIVSFSGDVLGTVVVSFHKDAAVKLVEAFAGCILEPDTADFSDALGELTNLIAGGAKKDLGNAATISVPTVIIGKGHIVARPSDVPCLVVPITTALGAFAVEISIKTA